MKVLVSGATGLLGAHLVPTLEAEGHDVRRLTRRPRRATDVSWDPSHGTLDTKALADIEAVVHFAGENIADGRWTAARKRRILDSRVQGTSLLARLCAETASTHTLISASAIGFYGDRGDAVVDETSAPGTGFLAEVCQAWERATDPARDAGVRTANLRFGAVLADGGGMLAKMLPPFRLGVGGIVGPGTQWLSWVSVDDVVAATLHVLQRSDLAGPINVTAPEPVTNRSFTKALGRHLGRPTIAPLPAFVARLALGELADELLLASTRVTPKRLLESGYTFRTPTVDSAFDRVIRRGSRTRTEGTDVDP